MSLMQLMGESRIVSSPQSSAFQCSLFQVTSVADFSIFMCILQIFPY